MERNLSWYILENWSRVRCHGKGHFNTSRPDPGRKKKYNLNFYFHTSLWCLKRFYEGLKDVYKTFWRTTKECENKKIKLIFILIQLSEIPRVGRIHNRILLKPWLRFSISKKGKFKKKIKEEATHNWNVEYTFVPYSCITFQLWRRFKYVMDVTSKRYEFQQISALSQEHLSRKQWPLWNLNDTVEKRMKKMLRYELW